MRACALVCCILVQGCIASQPVSVDDETFMLQLQSKAHERHTRSGHYWPQPRGGLDHYSRTSYGVPRNILENGNLSDYLAWTWTHADYLDTSVKGTLIDKDKNIYIIAAEGIFKYTPDGELLWQRDDILGTQMGSISGSSLYAWDTYLMMYALDLDTGSSFWSRKVGENRGLVADMVTVNNGVVLAGVDQPDELPEGWRVEAGVWSKRVVGINASNGDELWSYQPDAGLWNIMGVFPDDDTVIFMDSGGGLYRLGLHNGSQLWKRAPDPETFTDGGATLGPDGSVYTCSNEPYSLIDLFEEPKGRMRKFDQTTGDMIWEFETAHTCMNFPAVSADGKTLVVSDGKIAIVPMIYYETEGMSAEAIDKLYRIQEEQLKAHNQNAYWGLEDVNGSIIGFDTQKGEPKWQQEVEPWYGTAFIRDEERAYRLLTGKGYSFVCGPPHWGGPTIDDDNNVYIGRSDGYLYVYNTDDKAMVTRFKTNDGMMMSGVSFAPGMMVVPTCSSVNVFRF
mmetsp:Transcript_14457/g.25552  ORF Transcript_14457/g.25552 Transcript_14457/m.25552 type:complete len:507 (-) Transcript_14457:106-1626(-)